jgi:hypothetical protein
MAKLPRSLLDPENDPSLDPYMPEPMPMPGEDIKPFALNPAGLLGGGGTVVPKAVGKGRAPAVGNMLDIRNMNPQEALQAARSERHLVQDKNGQYVGAPRGLKTREQLQAMRDNFDRWVDQGASGGDWYTRAGEWIRTVTGGDPAKADRLSQELALTSAQADPNTNLGFTLQGHNPVALGARMPKIVHTGAQSREMAASAAEGRPIKLGKKTGIYEGHMNPNRQGGPTGTNDIWHGRVLGYTNKDGKPFSGSFTPQEHAFIDHETVLAADRANQRGAGGRSNWTGGEVQAAPWVAAKGTGLATKYPKRITSVEQGIAQASKTYPDYAPNFTAYGTHEAIPGAGTGHLEGLIGRPYEERQAFANDPRSPWQTGPYGNDLLYSAGGLLNEPTRPATGYFRPHEGELEINPAQVSLPLVAGAKDVSGTTIHPRDQAVLTGIEGLRAYSDVQNMGAWHQTTNKSKVGVQGSIHIPLDRQLTPDEMTRLSAVADKHGLGISDTGRGVTLMDFSADASGKKAAAMLKKDGLQKDIQEIFPETEAERRRLISGNVDYEKAFQTPGKGRATKQLYGVLGTKKAQSVAPNLVPSLDASPELRQHMLDLNARDREYAAQTGMPVREDVLRARAAIAEGGPTGLFNAWKKNPALFPALGGAALLPGLLAEEDDKNRRAER